MRKKSLVFLIIVLILVGLLSACGSSNVSDDKTKDTFTGTIETIENDTAIVKIEEGEILKSGNKASVNLSVAKDTDFKVGQKVRVGFDGEVRERGPLGINTTSVELID